MTPFKNSSASSGDDVGRFRPCLLLVESDSRLRQQLTAFLQTRGFTVNEAASVGEALAALRRVVPDLALVATPLDEDAATVAFAVRQQAPNAGLILMGPPAAVDALRLEVGAEVRPQAVLEKPFTARQLASVVEGALEARNSEHTSRNSARAASARLDDEVGALAAALANLRPAAPPRPPSEPEMPPLVEAPLGPPPGITEDPPVLVQADGVLVPMTPTSAMDPRGIYGPATLAEILVQCLRDLHSGVLVLQRGPVLKTIYLMSGRPVAAESNVQAETLGARLSALGVVGPESLRKGLALAAWHKTRLGDGLVRLGALSTDSLRFALRDQLQARITACFGWDQGSYGLASGSLGAQVDPQEINPRLLVIDGIRLAPPTMALLTRLDGAMRRTVHPTTQMAECLAQLRDRPEIIEIAGLCDGTRVLAEVLADSPLAMLESMRVIRGLELLHCIALGELRPLSRNRATISSAAPMRIRPSNAFSQPPLAARPPEAGSAAPRVLSPISSAPRAANPASIGPRPQEVSSGAPRPASRSPMAMPPPENRPSDGVPAASRTSAAPIPGRPSTGTFRPVTRASTGSPAAERPEQTSGSFRAIPRAPERRTASQPPDRPSITNMMPGRRPISVEEAPVERSPAALLRAEIERIEQATTHYAALGLNPDAHGRIIRDQATRVLRMLHTDQVLRLDDTLAERARAAAHRLAQAAEVLSNRNQRETYDALNLPVPVGGQTVDLLAAESSFNRGVICVQHTQVEKAQRYFQLAVAQDPHQAVYKVHLAAATFTLTPPEDRRTRNRIIDEARAALDATSGRDDVCVLVAEMAIAAGNTELGTRLYNKALDINAGSVRAREALVALESAGQKAGERPAGLLNKLFTRR